MCVAHSLGIQIQNTHNHATSTEGGNSLFRAQSATRNQKERRLDFGASLANENLPEPHSSIEQQLDQREQSNDEFGNESYAVPQQTRNNAANRRIQIMQENQELVLQLCQNKAFDEGKATRLLCGTPEGIAVQFNRNFKGRLKTAISISKTLVFQENTRQRVERSKEYALQRDPTANDFGTSQKKNNLFFYGPPSTGKTMVMESLVEMHYNYTRRD
ncbi:unnamed protein product [Leptidea sinapis]|uniref:Uncharacterized protein n=1 Tax=Leptidea sinapis TaxID=189913 RepID=A0A5E4PZ49_9NEOP|nr:unnamed protein product [Leptidea sinapis]